MKNILVYQFGRVIKVNYFWFFIWQAIVRRDYISIWSLFYFFYLGEARRGMNLSAGPLQKGSLAYLNL
jgi:hypothetical protein